MTSLVDSEHSRWMSEITAFQKPIGPRMILSKNPEAAIRNRLAEALNITQPLNSCWLLG
jgi:hypothetical protein